MSYSLVGAVILLDNLFVNNIILKVAEVAKFRTVSKELKIRELPYKVAMLPIYINFLLFMPAALLSMIHLYLSL